MRVFIGAAAAVFVLAAAPAFAQTTAPAAAAPAAPAINYVSPCPRPKLEPYPVIPNAATVKPSESSRANREYQAWVGGVKAFTECKRQELAGIDKEVDAERAKSPFAAKITEYERVLDEHEKGVAAFKATGIPEPGIDGKKLKKPGEACPAAPTTSAAPIPTFAAADAKKSEISKAQKAFAQWREPRYVYLTCTEVELKAKAAETDAALAPLKAKKEAAFGDYEVVNNQVKTFNARWDEFAKAYNARIKAAAGN